jgi:hypothetical protein
MYRPTIIHVWLVGPLDTARACVIHGAGHESSTGQELLPSSLNGEESPVCGEGGGS